MGTLDLSSLAESDFGGRVGPKSISTQFFFPPAGFPFKFPPPSKRKLSDGRLAGGKKRKIKKKKPIS